MLPIVLPIMLAVVCGAVCVYALLQGAAAYYQRESHVLKAQGRRATLQDMAALRMRRGFPVLKPLAERLLRVDPVGRFCTDLAEQCSARGYETDASALLTVLMVADAALCAIVALATGSVVGGIAVAVCAIAVAVVVTGAARDRRREQMREEVPDVLELMGACFGAGFTLMQTFQQIAAEVPGKLGAEFGKCAHVLEMGGSAEDALALLRRRADIPELAFVVAALDVQHKSGGSLKPVLNSAMQSVKGELALKRSLRVQTAQAKLSARIVIIMPFVLIAAFSLISPDFLAPFFASPAGYGLLALAIIMQLAGIMLVRRALNVDGVS